MNMLGAVWAKVLQLIDLAAKLVVVGVPVLYLMGWSYLETYWKGLGVDDTLLGLSTVDYLRSGAMVLTVSIIELAPWVKWLAMVCLVAIIALMAIRLFWLPHLFAADRQVRAAQAAQLRDARRRTSPKHRELAQTLDALVDMVSAGALAVLFSFLLLIGFIFLGIKPAHTMAEEEAAKTMESIRKAGLKEDNRLIAHLDGLQGRSALVVKCVGEACILATGERIEVWPRSAVTRMETCRRVGKTDDGRFHCLKRTELL